MSPSPAERFSSLLARSGEQGWSPADDLGEGVADPDDDFDGDLGDDCEEDEPAVTGTRPWLSKTVLLCLLGAVLTGVLVLVLAPSLLRGADPLASEESAGSWEAAQADASEADASEADASGGAQTTGDGTAAAAGSGAESDGAGEAASAGPIVVHVVGAVAAPGVVELPPGARVSDALDAAGGASEHADVDVLNLARVLVDGEQIRVPRPGEEIAPGDAGGADPGGAGSGTDAAGAGSGGAGPGGAGPGGAGGVLVDLNSADLAALETLPGVGPVTAQSILDHRDAIGRFTTVDELLDVSGIGDATLSRIRDSVTVG